MSELTVVLVRPAKPKNLGAIARVMMNFNYQRLILVQPILDREDPEIFLTARRAREIIDSSITVASIDEAIVDSSFVIATTARYGGDRNLKRLSFFPEEMPLENIGSNPALLFGNESDGLTNEEIEKADFLVTIPTMVTYSSMNISHAVAILLYTISRMTDTRKHPYHRSAEREEREVLFQVIEKVIKQNLKPEQQIATYQVLENVVKRANIRGREIHTLIGLFRKIERKNHYKE